MLTSGDARLKFDGVGLRTASANTDYNLASDTPKKILITDGSSTLSAVVQNDQSVAITKDMDDTPNAFFGKRSGLNFADYRRDLNINLDDGKGTLGSRNVSLEGINKVQAGDGFASLIGSNDKDTLIAGNVYTSIWGGAGNDKLVGKGNSAEKDGRTTFFFFAGDGHDTISDFGFITPENRYSGNADKINVGDSDINDAYSLGDNVVIEFDQNSYLVLQDAVGKDFQIANMIAKVDKNIIYDGLDDCYVASGGSSLTVDSSVDSAEIWLDSSHGTKFFGNIRTLDASAVEGNTSLVGNEFGNTIIAGQGDASLWGGSSASNDVLIGGGSRNTFFYLLGNGNDTVNGTNDGDEIAFSDITLDQISSADVTADSVSLKFVDGGSLTVNGTSESSMFLLTAQDIPPITLDVNGFLDKSTQA